MKHLILIISLLASSLSFAGSADALIKGITASKRTSVEVSVGDISGLIRHVKLEIDGKSYTIKSGKDTVIRDEKNGVYVLIIENENHLFRMWMIPGSEKVISKTSGSYRSTFAAVIEATDPRGSDKWKFTPRITIGCSLDYSI